VVVATRGRHASLDACLASIGAAGYPDCELIVVDNSAGDADVAEIAAAHGARYVLEAEGGLSRARNAGAREAAGDVVAFIDDDAEAEPGWLNQLVQGFQDELTLVVTGRIVPFEVRTNAQRIYRDLGGLDPGPELRVLDRSMPSWFETANFGGIGYGGNMAFARRAFEVWPGFREDLGLGSPLHGAEEQHAFFSIVRQGFRIAYRPEAIVRHPYPASMQSLRGNHVRDLERVAGYAALLFAEAPEHRVDVMRFAVDGILRRPRPWKRASGRRYASLVPMSRMAAAGIRGIRLYGQSRRLESERASRRRQEESVHPSVLMLGKGWFPEQLGGLDRYFRDLFEHLPEATAVIIGPAPEAPTRVAAASSHEAWLPRRFLALWRASRAARCGARIVDAHFALYALVPMVIGPLRSLPAIVHFQGPWADENVAAGDSSRIRRKLRRVIECLVYRRAARIVVLTSAFRRILVEQYGIAPWSVRVAPPGVDLEHFTPGNRTVARDRLGVPQDAFVAVSVRRLVPRMGLDVLVEAWAAACDELPAGSRLLIVGQGPEHQRLHDQVARLDVAHSVQLLGPVQEATLLDIYRAADVGVVPTRSFEGFGLIVIEAAACGTPSIVTRVGGLPEAARGLDTSLIVAPDDASALALRIVQASRPDGLPARDVTRRFAEGFSWEAAVERNRAVIREVLAPPPAARHVRVVYLGHVAQLSGGEIALLRLLPHLREVEPHVILAEEGPLVNRLVQAGISAEVLPMASPARDLRKHRVTARSLPLSAMAHSATYVIRLAIHLRRLRPDLVHANSLKAGVYGSLAARIAGVPFVWHVRDRIATDYLPAPAVRLIRTMVRHLADGVVANSQVTIDTVGPIDPATISKVLPSTISKVLPDVLPPVPIPAAARNSRACAFGMVGRIASWKGQDLFLRAFASAFADGVESAVIIGAPMFDEQHVEDDLRQLAEDLGIAEQVEFRGFREDVWRELQDLDVLVHASTTPEPFGQVVVEGMAAGLPVVASNEGGPAEILDDGVTGCLFKARDVAALACVLTELRDSPQKRARLGAAARLATDPFEGDVVAAELQTLYRAIIARDDASQ